MWKNLLIFLLPTLGGTSALNGQNILHYRAVLLLAQPIDGGGPPLLALRSFVRDTEEMYLVLDPDSVTTSVRAAKKFRATPTDWNALHQIWSAKPYLKALDAARRNDAPQQDAGLTRTNDPEPGITLTADLCPSHLPLDRRIFTALAQTAAANERPVPITLSVSGLWIQTHKADLAWLLSAVARGDLRITWTNHTLHHHWEKDLPLDKNFLLEHGTDLSTEILGNEELMLENGLLPSCFFRFPGLVSDKAITDQILDWGLIPIGSDAWLAKGQHPQTAGSIVLIHANGNEPVGIDDFLRLLQQEKPALQRGQWRLLDLREEVKKE